MDNTQTVSWIFLALGMASQNSTADFAGISQIADGINHCVPTQKEMQTSLSWLLSKQLILKIGRKYSLTENGKNIYRETENEESTLLKMWENLGHKLSLL